MRKIILTALVALVAVGGYAKTTTKNPRGLYRLQKFIYEDGSTKLPGIQYKYATDSVTLTIFFNPSQSNTKWASMEVDLRDTHPLVETGEKPQGADGHDTQVFNVDDRQFYFKWYNDRWPDFGKFNQFITEIYAKDGAETEVTQAFDLFENKIDTTANRFYGWWIRVGATADPSGTGQRHQVPTIWKCYSPKLSMVVHMLNNGTALGCNTTNTVKYKNDSLIYEIGHPCNIHWLNKDCHALTFIQENGVPLTEIWIRAGLPTNWQSIFKTNLETYRNGVACITDAVETAIQKRDLPKAEAFIAEAIEKDVPIEVLCEGTMGIAMGLLNNNLQYKECVDFCNRQLQVIKNYTENGHDHTSFSRIHLHMTELCKAIATYRSGNTAEGKQMMEERLSIVDSEIERYKDIKGMERYINLLYYHNFMMYYLGYDILGAERTLLYLDALTLMAPNMTSQNKKLLLHCRANCYLFNGDKDSARKLWQQVKDLDPNFFKKQPADNPLKMEFGE